MNARKLKLAGITIPFFTLPGERLLIAAVILILTTMLSASMQKNPTSISLYAEAHAQETNVEPASVSPAEVNSAWRSCQIAGVAAWADRIHVKCTTAEPANIFYFAAPTTNSAHANRLLSVLLTAQSTTGKVGLDYDTRPDPSYSCNPADCRPLYGVEAWR
jgi:hypothetical protein